MYVIMYVFTVLSGHGKSKVPKYLKPFTLKAIGVNGLNFFGGFFMKIKLTWLTLITVFTAVNSYQ